MVSIDANAGGFSGADFRIGQVISKTVQVFSANIVTYSLVTGIVAIPAIILGVIGQDEGDPQMKAIIGVASFVALMFLSPLATAIILHAAFQSMRGRTVRLGEALGHGLMRFLPLVGVMILYTLGIMAGMMLLLIPGFILLTMWYVAVPACVVERVGPIRSLGRSRALTKGYRWKVFALFLLVTLISMIGNAFFEFLVQTAAGLWGRVAAQLLWQAVWGGFSAVLIVVTYYHLRVAKEGVDIDQIVTVFD